MIYFKGGLENDKQDKNITNDYQFSLFVDALLLAQKQKQQKDIIWISSIGNQTNQTQLSTKPALLINPTTSSQYREKAIINKLTSHMDLQSTLMTNWLNCSLENKNYSNGY